MKNLTEKKTIQALVNTAVESYADGFRARHEAEFENPEGIINMKVHNVFIEALGKDIQYYTALVRSLDSSLGNMLEGLAINIAKLSFEVKRNVEGPLSIDQTRTIAELLEKYKRREKKPEMSDYQLLRNHKNGKNEVIKRHDSDYYLIDRDTNSHYLIELKIGGDLDNKKARSEKEAILEQYAILSNTLTNNKKIQIFFATAYNRFGEDKPWRQERVRQFFADDELLIGRKFWDFVCQNDKGYEWSAGIRGVLYREIKNSRNFKKIDEGTYSLADYDINKLALSPKDLITTKDVLTAIRIGQSEFRKKLIASLKKCPFTGIDDIRILTASHIKPWTQSTNPERLDVKNGFLFSPTFDRLFDRGLISFSNDKTLLVSSSFSPKNLARLNLREEQTIINLPIVGREEYLEYHRSKIFIRD